ncbi:MAG: hypothetical protein ACHQ4H_05030 [Ktedonobacterales bacterium]
MRVTTCFGGLLGRWWPAQERRLALGWGDALLHDPRPTTALDAVGVLGTGTRRPVGGCLTVLSLSMVYRGGAIPVTRANTPGAWRPHWERLLTRVQGRLPTGWLGRGRAGPSRPLRALVARGWHPFLRITGGPKGSGPYRRAAAGVGVPFRGGCPTAAAPRRLPHGGTQWCGEVVCFVEHAVCCTRLTRWEPGYRAGRRVLTDLPPAVAEVAWYGVRAWI